MTKEIMRNATDVTNNEIALNLFRRKPEHERLALAHSLAAASTARHRIQRQREVPDKLVIGDSDPFLYSRTVSRLMSGVHCPEDLAK